MLCVCFGIETGKVHEKISYKYFQILTSFIAVVVRMEAMGIPKEQCAAVMLKAKACFLGMEMLPSNWLNIGRSKRLRNCFMGRFKPSTKYFRS